MTITQVGSKQIYRGPRPHLYSDWTDLEAREIKTVINLERGWFEWFHGMMNDENYKAAAVQIMPVHIQLGDLFTPTRRELNTALYLVEDALKLGPVYIHCLHGVDRTGMVCAMIRAHIYGWSEDQAIQEMYNLGFHRFPYEQLGWVKRLRECL